MKNKNRFVSGFLSPLRASFFARRNYSYEQIEREKPPGTNLEASPSIPEAQN